MGRVARLTVKGESERKMYIHRRGERRGEEREGDASGGREMGKGRSVGEGRDKETGNMYVSSMHTCGEAQMCSRSEPVTFPRDGATVREALA